MSTERISFERQLTIEDSSSDGLLRQLSTANALLRCNWSATVNPTISNDTNQGYTVGSIWVNTTDNQVWTCTNPTGGGAIWVQISSGPANIDGGGPSTNYGAAIPINGGTP